MADPQAPDLKSLLPQLIASAPQAHALGIAFVAAEDDVLTLRCPYKSELIGDPETGVLAGGVATTLLDHACGFAVWLKMERMEAIATLDLRIDYMRPAKPGLDLMARARCYKVTRSIAFVRAWAYDDDPDDPVAAAQASFMLDSNAGRKPGANLAPSRKGGSGR